MVSFTGEREEEEELGSDLLPSSLSLQDVGLLEITVLCAGVGPFLIILLQGVGPFLGSPSHLVIKAHQ